MEIDDALIHKVAQLARLRLDEEEVSRFGTEFQEVLDAFSVLDEFSVEKDDRITIQPVQEQSLLRTDETAESLSQEQALAYTQDTEDGYFVGPRIRK